MAEPKALILAVLVLLACGQPRPAATADDYFEIRPPTTASPALAQSLGAVSTRNVSGRFAATEMGRAPRLRLEDLLADPQDANEGGRPRPEDFVTLTGSWAEEATSLFPVTAEILETPYWTSIFFQVSAVGGGRLFAAYNLAYPIHVFGDGGAPLDTLGTPPPTWRKARRPASGEFSPERRQEWAEYLRSFTMIAGLAVIADSVLVVNHGRFEPGATTGEGFLSRPVAHATVDVYVNGERVTADLASPGEIVAYSGPSVFFAARAGADAGWKVIEWVWRGGR